jgi:hypothetical protein
MAGIAMTELAAVYPAVRRRLEQWAGHEALSRVLRDCRDVEFFLAGGVIRNCVLGVTPPDKDFDFFVNGPSIGRALDIFREYGVLATTPFGSARWHPNGDPDHSADLIRIDEFRPGLWRCEDIVDVLNQFDYTASALAFDLRTGESFNPQNGLRDLTRRTMRMIRFDFPDTPFVPDSVLTMKAILWFRILHYARTQGLVIEPLTLEWLRTHRAFERLAEPFRATFFQPCDGYLEPL